MRVLTCVVRTVASSPSTRLRRLRTVPTCVRLTRNPSVQPSIATSQTAKRRAEAAGASHQRSVPTARAPPAAQRSPIRSPAHRVSPSDEAPSPTTTISTAVVAAIPASELGPALPPSASVMNRVMGTTASSRMTAPATRQVARASSSRRSGKRARSSQRPEPIQVEAMVADRPTGARTSPATAMCGLTRRSVDVPNQAARAHRMTALKTV